MLLKLYHQMPPIIAGITLAKAVAFLAGIIVFLLLPKFVPEIDPIARWALLFWYPTIAGIAAASNIAELIDIKFMRWQWWQRSVLIGAWLNLIVTLFASDTMQDYSMLVHLSFGMLSSQFWFVADGAIVGLIAGFASTRVQQRDE